VPVYVPGVRLVDSLTPSDPGQGRFTLGLHVLAALMCTAFGMAAVGWRLRFQSGIGRITLLTGLFLLLGGAASVAPTMTLAASLGYDSSAPVDLLEVGIFVAFFVAGLGIARWILSRRPRPTQAAG
jgi:hypothetical protein